MGWLHKLGRKLSGAQARELAAEARRRREVANEVLAEHEARDHFDAQRALDRLIEEMPEDEAVGLYSEYCAEKISPAVNAALEDGLLSPEEEARIEAVRQRYGGFQLGSETQQVLGRARTQYEEWTSPLEPVQTPLLLKRGEWCVHAVEAEALEERQRTVGVLYGGPTARVRLMKGVYYRAGFLQAKRVKDSFQHSFGNGILGATNKRLLWISPAKSISIPLSKIVLFEPFVDGLKIIKETGKPLLFAFGSPDQKAMVRISRVIEELR